MSQSDPTPDLSSLIKDAANMVASEAAREIKPPQRKPVPWLLRAALAVAAVFSAYTIWSYFAPPSDAQVAVDLGQAIDLARISVEEIRKQTGELPAALPNAALATVVTYEAGKNDYKLTATVMGLRITLDRDGKKSTETGVK